MLGRRQTMDPVLPEREHVEVPPNVPLMAAIRASKAVEHLRVCAPE